MLRQTQDKRRLDRKCKQLLKLIVDITPKTPLRFDEIESVDEGTYIRKKIMYSSEPGEYILAYLLIPVNCPGPRPTVCCHHIHANNFHAGKSEIVGLAGSTNQAIGLELVHRGYIVIAPDAFGFEERVLTSREDDFLGVVGYFNALTHRLIQGDTLQRKALMDIIRAIDVLVAHPLVDPKRIGFLGFSLGGNQAIFAAAVDQRIRAAVAHCAVSSYREKIKQGIKLEPCLVIPGILEKFGDIEDVLSLVAPRAFLISSTGKDKYCVGSEEIYLQVKEVYQRLHASEALEFNFYPEYGHEFTKDMRSNAYSWLDSHLMV